MPKIIIFGGTCEGRRLAEAFQGTKLELHICVATQYGASLLPVCENIHVHAGRMDAEEMSDFLKKLDADCCLDATHPYAVAVTENIFHACQEEKLPYIRVLRREESISEELRAEACRDAGTEAGAGENQVEVVYRESVAEAVEFLASTSGNILITTGSRDLQEYTGLADYQNRCFARVLPTLSVMEKCKALGFEGRNLIGMQGPFSEELNFAMLKQVNASWMVTKSSGKEGGYPEKCEAAIRAGVNIVVIGRPAQKAENAMELEEAVAFLREKYGIGEAAAKKEGQDAAKKDVQTSQQPEGTENIHQRQVYLIGMGPGKAELLTKEAQDCLAKCDVWIGAKRMLEICREFEEKPLFMSYRKEEICAFLREHPEYEKAAVVYSGDIGFYSGAKGMQELLAEFEVHPVCGISSPLYFLNRLGLPWEDVRLVSCHGQSGNLFSEILHNRRVCALLGEKNAISDISRSLLEFGLSEVKITVGERLSYPEENIVCGMPSELAGREFDTLSVALFENPAPKPEPISPGIKDSAFIREKVPMTKEEVRILSLAKLRLMRESVVYDVGAGTGSVSVEAANLCTRGRVYAVEKKPEAVELLWKNRGKFAAWNMEIVEGCAPECLEALEAPTHVFVGGSSGRLSDIVEAVRRKNREARFVINAVTLETLSQIEKLKIAYPEYADMEIVQVNVARSRALGGYHLMSAENPVFIISFGGEAS